MAARQFACIGLLVMSAAGGTLVRAGQQGVGQLPSPLPLTSPIRERGSSVSPAYEGWYYEKDGSVRVLVGYFNRNTKQEFDIPAGPNNRIDGIEGGPDKGQPTHFLPGRQWGLFSIALPKDFGNKKATWTIVANGFTNTVTLHTQADYIVEPFGDAANKNTPPVLKFTARRSDVHGGAEDDRREVHRHGRDSACPDGVGDRRRSEDQHPGAARARPRGRRGRDARARPYRPNSSRRRRWHSPGRSTGRPRPAR